MVHTHRLLTKWLFCATIFWFVLRESLEAEVGEMPNKTRSKRQLLTANRVIIGIMLIIIMLMPTIHPRLGLGDARQSRRDSYKLCQHVNAECGK